MMHATMTTAPPGELPTCEGMAKSLYSASSGLGTACNSLTAASASSRATSSGADRAATQGAQTQPPLCDRGGVRQCASQIGVPGRWKRQGATLFMPFRTAWCTHALAQPRIPAAARQLARRCCREQMRALLSSRSSSSASPYDLACEAGNRGQQHADVVVYG